MLRQDKKEYNKKEQSLKDKNAQIEQENRQMQLEVEQKIAEAEQKAIEIAKQRAQSKVKKPTIQEVKRAKDRGQDAMEAYKAKLKAQEEKELQVELNKLDIDSYDDDKF